MKSIILCAAEPKQQPWGVETLLAETEAYTLKRLDYRAGQGGGLQFHMKRSESFHLVSGDAIVRYDRGDGVLVEERMFPGQTFTIPAGAPHQFEAVTDCVVFEAGQPGVNDRVNVAHRYGREMAPGTLPTTWTDAEIAAFEGALS